MDELVKVLSAEIKAEARRAVEEFHKAVEMFADLPGVSTTQELAKVLRVSDDVVRRTAEEGGMPHLHVGRELRFVKNLIAEWSSTGKRFFCEVCGEKSGKPSLPAAPTPATFEQPQYSPFSQKSASLNSKTKRRLADFASAK